LPEFKSYYIEEGEQIPCRRDFPVKRHTVCQLLLQSEGNRNTPAFTVDFQGAVSGTWYQTSSSQHSCQWSPVQQILDVLPLQP